MTKLPPGWAEVSLEDIAATSPRSITDGPFGSNLKTEHYTTEGPRVVRLQNIGDGTFRDDQSHISDERYLRLRAHDVKPGDVLVAALGEVLPRACVAPPWLGPAIVKADCFRFRLRDDVNPHFVAAVLNSPQVRSAARSQIAGVGRPRMNLGKVRKLSIPLPPIAEQDRIVAAIEEHFSHLDAAEVALWSAERRIRALEKSIITDASSTLTPPQHWKNATVADAGTVSLGLQRSPKRHSGPNMRPYLRVANVFEDRLDDNDVMSMDMTDAEWERYRLRDGDVLLNEGQSPEFLGRPAIYRGRPPDTAFTNSLIRFRANEDIDPEWALLVFRSHLHNRRFMRESQITTNIAHLSAERFKTVEFPIPPLDEQQARVADARLRLEGCARLRAEVAAGRRRSAILRRSVLAAALSGRLILRDQDQGAGSRLLDRAATGSMAKEGTARAS